MPTIKWVTVAVTTLLDTELNALANNAAAEDSSSYDNATNLYLWGDFELVLASLTPTGTPSVELYLVQAVDGTNYGDRTTGASGVAQFSFFKGTFIPTTSAGAKRLVLSGVTLPPTLFKAFVINKTGVTLGATLNTLKMLPYNEQSI